MPLARLSLMEGRLESLFFNTCFLTGEIAEVEDSSSADGAMLVDIDFLDEGAADGELSLIHI